MKRGHGTTAYHGAANPGSQQTIRRPREGPTEFSKPWREIRRARNRAKRQRRRERRSEG